MFLSLTKFIRNEYKAQSQVCKMARQTFDKCKTVLSQFWKYILPNFGAHWNLYQFKALIISGYLLPINIEDSSIYMIVDQISNLCW